MRDADESLGEVDHVLVDCEGQYITHLIVRQGLFSDYVIVPVDAIVEVDDAGILLTLARDEVRTLRDTTAPDRCQAGYGACVG